MRELRGVQFPAGSAIKRSVAHRPSQAFFDVYDDNNFTSNGSFRRAAFQDNPTLAMAGAQDDPRLVSIKERISRTTPRGKQIIERVLRTKIEINEEISPRPFSQMIQRVPIHVIGWEASPKRFGRWRIILHYHQDNRMQSYDEAEWEYKPKTGKLLLVEANSSVVRRGIVYSRTYKFRERRVKVVVQDTSLADWSPPYELHTVVGGRKYFIGYVHHRGAVLFRKPVIDPTCTHVSYSSNTGGGYEGEGTISFISDLHGKRKYLILGDPDKFLKFNGKDYLLMSNTSDADETDSIFLYEVNARSYVVHAKGDLEEKKRGVFAYHYYSNGGRIERVPTVTMRNLVNRESPLKLLPMPRPRFRCGLNKQGNSVKAAAASNARIDIEKKRQDVSHLRRVLSARH